MRNQTQPAFGPRQARRKADCKSTLIENVLKLDVFHAQLLRMAAPYAHGFLYKNTFCFGTTALSTANLNELQFPAEPPKLMPFGLKAISVTIVEVIVILRILGPLDRRWCSDYSSYKACKWCKCPCMNPGPWFNSQSDENFTICNTLIRFESWGWMKELPSPFSTCVSRKSPKDALWKTLK